MSVLSAVAAASGSKKKESGVSPKQEERKLARALFGARDGHEQFSPSSLRAVIAKNVTSTYLESLNLKGAKFSADAFEKYEEAATKPKDTKTTAADEFYKQLNEKTEDSTLATARTEVKNALKNDPEALKKARTEYELSVAAFKDLVAKVPEKYKVRDIIGAMKDIVDTGKKSIVEQQKRETANLDTKFEDLNFKKAIKIALKLDTDADVEKVHKAMAADLKETHARQTAAFDKSGQDSLNSLHKAAAKQSNEFLLMRNMSANSSIMRKLIEEQAIANREEFKLGKSSSTEMDMTATKGSNISSVNLKQLEFIKTVGGNKISVKSDDKDNPYYTLDLGMRLLNPRYYMTDQYIRDLDIMIQAVKASGSEKITMTVNFSNPEIAKRRARETYEACIKNGYDPDKITLKVNGTYMTSKEMEQEINGEKVKTKSIQAELYEGKENRYAQIQKVSQEIRKELADVEKGITITPSKPTDQAVLDIKRDIETFKKEAEKTADKKDEKKHDADVGPDLGAAKEETKTPENEKPDTDEEKTHSSSML